MPITVFPWPPVGVLSSEWTSEQPMMQLRSMMTGRTVRQSSQRRRRVATLVVSALAAGRAGAGYCELLKDLLEGGVHGIRLRSTPVNGWLDELARAAPALNPQPLEWRLPPARLAWRSNGDPLYWMNGALVLAGDAQAAGPFTLLPVTGLPRNLRVAAPGDVIRLFDAAHPDLSETARVMRIAVTDHSGAVTLKLDRRPGIAGARIHLAGQEEAVFQVDGPLPRAVQPLTGDWSYTWKLRQVFADEVGGFTERPDTWI